MEHPFSYQVCLELQIYGRISDPGTGRYPPRVALALRTPGWGFRRRMGHAVRGGIGSGDHRFRPPYTGVVDVRKDF